MAALMQLAYPPLASTDFRGNKIPRNQIFKPYATGVFRGPKAPPHGFSMVVHRHRGLLRLCPDGVYC
jgi:hypothetical protein